MAAFIEQLAEAILAEQGTDLGEIAVVLPSQRAGLYLRQALAQKAGAALWSPEIFTLASFMERLSGSRTLSTEELLFEGFEAYRSIAGPDGRTFDDFMAWAPVTLADISEADAHLVDLQGFYRDLRSWEELEWSFNTVPLSQGQQRMVNYWTLAGKLHGALNERLLAAKCGTMGLVERTAAEQNNTPFPWKRIWFAGLNAFNLAEERVIDRALNAGVARFAWDADRYYVKNKDQESGQQLRAAIDRYGPGAVPLSEELSSGNLNLTVMQAPNSIAQVWCAADLLLRLAPEERARTAVILADESLLPALLEALPADAGPLNITMGLSVAQLPVGSLVDAYFRASASRRSDGSWLFTDLEQLLRHPYLRHAGTLAPIDALTARLRNARMMFVPADKLREAVLGMDDAVRDHAFVVFDDQVTDRRTQVVSLLAWAQRTMAGDAFATEQIYQASIVLRRVHVLLEKYGHSDNPQAWHTVLSRLMRAARVGLFGEPLSGLQVMGLLEARALDHYRVIVLGTQEGKLPSSSADRSYIPFELRRAYGLPLRDSTDAVQAYNFLRMLQRAKEAVLVYADDGTASGPSRYIAQLAHELFHDAPERLQVVDARVPVPMRIASRVHVPHSEASQAAIRERLAKGLSPTMLRAWLKCPLDFWFRYVQGLREPEEPGARIASNALGDAVHGIIEDIYRPWLNHPLNAEQLNAASIDVPDALHERLLKHVPDALLRSGQPLLQAGMAARAAQAFLRAEAKAVEQGVRIVPQDLERELIRPLDPLQAGFGFPVNVKGRLDRIDARDGLIHILDLKTGRVDEKTLRIKEISLDAVRGDKGFAAQLLMYAWLWFKEYPQVETLRTGLLPMQKATASEGFYLSIDGEDIIPRSVLPAITGMIELAVSEMLDTSRSFSHDPKSRYCVFCATDN
ncbi:MAG: PD-(D/E)XK nuclease family protein [Flavobacteriales bacterium]|nr:PD-(D/E)XK nuclease family protein [Flavobacteriales bacterium]